MRVLLVDDDALFLGALGRVLRAEGAHVITASTGREALKVALARDLDIIAIDWELGEPPSGIEVVGTLRARGTDVPVLVFSGRHGRDACRQAFAAGAQDFVTKPLSEEFLARLRQACRHRAALPSPKACESIGGVLAVGRLRLDRAARAVWLDDDESTDRESRFSRTERDVLLALAARPGECVSIEQLLDAVWHQRMVEPHVVEVTVSKIRKKLGSARGLLATAPGRRGYRLGSGSLRRLSTVPETGVESSSRARERESVCVCGVTEGS